MSRIICGDAVTELAGLPAAAFACIITSPPYNLGWTNPASKAGKGEGRKRRWRGGYAGGDTDDMPPDDYVQYHRAALDGMLNALKPDGLLWYVHRRQPRFDGTMMPALIDRALSGYPVRAELVWDKGGPGAGFCGAGPPPAGAYYPTPMYESVFLLAKDRTALVQREIAAQGNIWRLPRQRVAGHPAAFPVALAARCISATLADGPVLDPFCGAGTTLIAAVNAGRDYVGIDRAPEYVQLARERLAGLPGLPPQNCL